WAGGQTLVDFVQWCIQDGISMATVYAFSTENWNRDPIEVTTLMTIFAKYAETFVTEALNNDVCVNVFSTGNLMKYHQKVS
ncbi:MAG: undecaprenyl diphosphate synthase family protein, partial [Cyanobacteria bacterium]|nr:undecaprenyl diphosphate synthase family protein [Cyanobacteriota bacterium]